ncbi:hypothetical protein B0H17DRAFT_1198422 [Mycena rosella]|uniref:ABM domain-containing protein n=1 Tax=Mycena rosella TaxID=1033263 RepID=A0AAD7GN47_MYCRO|nr:hypothetical protein B0H17DRAFT_1198422 [Mycena rosella]
MPTVQTVSFPASDAFLEALSNDPDKIKDPLTGLLGAKGHISSFYGLQVEDKKIVYFVSVWESLEARQAFTKDPSYAELIEKIKPAAAAPLERHHIDVKGDAKTAFVSPVTELVVFTLKPEGTPEKVVPLFEELAKGLDAAVGARPPCMWGQSIDDKTKFLVHVGWDTVAAHWEAVKEGTDLNKTVGKLGALADFSLGHSRLKQG